jgi:hypothetical protein
MINMCIYTYLYTFTCVCFHVCNYIFRKTNLCICKYTQIYIHIGLLEGTLTDVIVLTGVYNKDEQIPFSE